MWLGPCCPSAIANSFIHCTPLLGFRQINKVQPLDRKRRSRLELQTAMIRLDDCLFLSRSCPDINAELVSSGQTGRMDCINTLVPCWSLSFHQVILDSIHLSYSTRRIHQSLILCINYMSLVTNHGTEPTKFYGKLLARLSVFRCTPCFFFTRLLPCPNACPECI